MRIRLRIDLGYAGTRYAGWAIQPVHRTVQGELEVALAVALRLDRSEVRTIVAGRTDAGVHAVAQVCHLNLPEGMELSARAQAELSTRVQGALGSSGIVIHRIGVAPEGFDARFSPLWRSYRYRICDATSFRNPLFQNFTLKSPYNLDGDAMNTLGRELSGLHDWASFCKPRVGATTIRELMHYSWERDAEGVLVATVTADAFCHSMVRSLVGAAVSVGRGKISVEEAIRMRDAKKRSSLFPTMPAQGLALIHVEYPPDSELLARAELTRNRRNADPD